MRLMLRLLKYPFFFSAVFLFPLLVLSQTATTPQIKKTEADDPSREPAIIEEMSTSVRFENDGTDQEVLRQRIRIQNEAGLKLYGIITFSFIAGDQFTIDTVEVHKKDGGTVKASAANIQEMTPEIDRIAPMYSDVRQKQVTVPGLSIGDEVVFQYTDKRNALVPGQFWFEHTFTQDAVVLSESLEINVPKGRALHMNHQPGYNPTTSEIADRTIYRWQTSHPRIEDREKRQHQLTRELATGNAPPPDIELSTFSSWSQVGSWYYGLQRERAVPDAAVRAKAQELTKGLINQDDKIKALYEYVSTNFRYISLDFGIGRYQPHPAGEVLSNNYGDCKDKHTLLAALLQAVGIQTAPVLINTRRQPDPEVPSPGQFDHVITAVYSGSGNDWKFLDSTVEIAPYHMLLLPLRQKKGLLVKDGNSSQFVETPKDLPFAAQEVFELDGKVDESGTMEAEITYSFHGDTEILIKTALRQAPPSKYKDIVQFISYSGGFAGDVSNVNVNGLDSPDSPLRIIYHYHRPNYFDFHDSPPRNSLPLSISHLPAWSEDLEMLRLYTSAGDLTYRCKVTLPAGVTAQPPLPVQLDRDYLHYESHYATDKSSITGERKISILKPEIGAAHRLDYEALRRAIQSDETQQVVLRLPVGFVAKSEKLAPGELDDLMRRADMEYHDRDYEDALSDYRKLANQDPKHKGVWRQIGLVEVTLRRFDDSISDLQKAIAADPFDASAHAELGASYLGTHKDELAIAELNKATEVDPLNHRAFYLLGWHYAQKRDYQRAVLPLEKALATDSQESNESAQIKSLLSTAYFETKQPEKALPLVKSIVETAPTPMMWNNAAYMLADHNYELATARTYADAALKGIYEHLNQIQPENIRREDLAYTAQLALVWDTVGWLDFRSGNLDLAEKYVHAAWLLNQQSVVGEHLGEIYEAMGMGRLPEANRFYAMSARASFGPQPSPQKDLAKERLIKLVGTERADKLIRDNLGEPSKLRTVALGSIGSVNSKGEFDFVFAPGPKLESVQLINGDSALIDGLKKHADQISRIILFPEGAPEKLVRRGIVTCTRYSGGCTLVFYNAEPPR